MNTVTTISLIIFPILAGGIGLILGLILAGGRRITLESQNKYLKHTIIQLINHYERYGQLPPDLRAYIRTQVTTMDTDN